MKKYLSHLITCLALTACSTNDNLTENQPISSTSLTAGNMPVAWQSPDIFKKYNPAGNSTMSNTWTNRFDASGISFNNKRTCTLITPRHVIMARHYTRPIFAPIIFHDRNGQRHERKLIAIKHSIGDTSIGLLDEPLPPQITPYPMPRATPELAGKLTNQYAIVTDQHKRLFVHQIAAISGRSIRFKHDKDKKNGYHKNLVSGDSGNPSFIILRGKPILIETHTTGGPGAGPFYGNPELQADITRIISEMDDTYSLRTITP